MEQNTRQMYFDRRREDSMFYILKSFFGKK